MDQGVQSAILIASSEYEEALKGGHALEILSCATALIA